MAKGDGRGLIEQAKEGWWYWPLSLQLQLAFIRGLTEVQEEGGKLVLRRLGKGGGAGTDTGRNPLRHAIP